jgi:hypothetical protein
MPLAEITRTSAAWLMAVPKITAREAAAAVPINIRIIVAPRNVGRRRGRTPQSYPDALG